MKKRTIWALFTTLVTAVAALAVAPTPAFAYSVPFISVLTPSGYSGKKVIDIRDGSMDDRGVAQLWAQNGYQQQKWVVMPLGIYSLPGGVEYPLYLFKRANTDLALCLDKSMDRGNVNGEAVYQYNCAGGAWGEPSTYAYNQQWYFVATGGNYGMLKSREDNRCLDVKDKAFTNGATLQVWDCSGEWNQLWNIQP